MRVPLAVPIPVVGLAMSAVSLPASGLAASGMPSEESIWSRRAGGCHADLSTVLLAVGLIGAGVLAVPILTGSAAYAVSEALGWQSGLSRRPGRAPGFYLVIVAATLVGMAINFVGIDPIDALVLSAVINGLIAAPLLVLVLLVCNNRAALGDRTNGRLLNVLGWGTALVIALAALALLVTLTAGVRRRQGSAA